MGVLTEMMFSPSPTIQDFLKRFIYIAVFSSNCLFSVQAQEAQSSDNTEDLTVQLKTPVPTLVASPGLCELQQGQTVCTMNTTLIWEAPRAGHFCLHDSEQKTPLQCWENSWSGTVQLNFEAANNRTFILTRGPKGSVAAKATISVTSTLVQRLRAKRRRSFWRMF